MEHYSAIKRNEFESLLVRWMNVELVMQSEVSQKKKDKYHILTHIWNLEEWYQRTYYRAAMEKQT